MTEERPEPTSRQPFRPRPFEAAWWASGPHAQTVAGKLQRRPPALELRRVRIDTPDGDFIDLDYGPEPTRESPLAVVLHGLEGSAHRSYVQQTFVALLRQGIQPVGFNFRTCGGEMNRTARFYHSGETGDLDVVLAHLRGEDPDRAIGAVGFSLGGNVLVKYLGELGVDAVGRVGAAAAISVPYDLAGGAAMLELGSMARVYTAYFLGRLKRKVQAKRALLARHLDIDAVLRTRTLREFDDLATAPLHGFRDAEDYYAQSSSGPFVARVRIPTLLLQALDDPFMQPASAPQEEADLNPHVVRSFVTNGGHVGFMEGRWPWRPSFWSESEAARFLRHHLLKTGRRLDRS